ncbi:hypothetical protein CBOM_00941 [Ceraceosorus bombacis]|uniref:Uncharacterized protein n=1 Tax=Ceraceosorus bombacis TaxID=401625 RepID=A0A0N7L974_9BASI|nr:hypothetical protein CBOM_00941 [Ceraceosorus bombacis]
MATPQPIPASSAVHPNAAHEYQAPSASPQGHRTSFSYGGGSGSLPRRVSPPLLSPILGRSNFGLAPTGSAQARRPGPMPITSAASPTVPAYSWAGTSQGSSTSSESDITPSTPKEPFSAPISTEGNGLATSPISGAPLGRVPSFPMGSGLPSEGAIQTELAICTIIERARQSTLIARFCSSTISTPAEKR